MKLRAAGEILRHRVRRAHVRQRRQRADAALPVGHPDNQGLSIYPSIYLPILLARTGTCPSRPWPSCRRADWFDARRRPSRTGTRGPCAAGRLMIGSSD